MDLNHLRTLPNAAADVMVEAVFEDISKEWQETKKEGFKFDRFFLFRRRNIRNASRYYERGRHRNKFVEYIRLQEFLRRSEEKRALLLAGEISVEDHNPEIWEVLDREAALNQK